MNFLSALPAAFVTLGREMKRIVSAILFLPVGVVCGPRGSFDVRNGLNQRDPQKEKMIVESRIVISLSPVEAMQLEHISLDRDKEEALRMIEKVILRKVREASAPH